MDRRNWIAAAGAAGAGGALMLNEMQPLAQAVGLQSLRASPRMPVLFVDHQPDGCHRVRVQPHLRLRDPAGDPLRNGPRARPGETMRFFKDRFQAGSISMRSLVWG